MRLLIAITIAAFATVAWAQPALNELDPTAGNFLDFPLDSVSRAANSAYQSAHYNEAARLYLSALEHDVTNSSDIYNLACCYGLLKQDSLAALYLKRAFRAGCESRPRLRFGPHAASGRGGSREPFRPGRQLAVAGRRAGRHRGPVPRPWLRPATCRLRLDSGIPTGHRTPRLRCVPEVFLKAL
jgi:hypothetical protein